MSIEVLFQTIQGDSGIRVDTDSDLPPEWPSVMVITSNIEEAEPRNQLYIEHEFLNYNLNL